VRDTARHLLEGRHACDRHEPFDEQVRLHGCLGSGCFSHGFCFGALMVLSAIGRGFPRTAKPAGSLPREHSRHPRI